MVRDSGAIFGISWFWFYSACVLSLYSTYGKIFLHVRQSVVTLFFLSFVGGITFSYLLFKTLLKEANSRALGALSSFGMSFFLIYLFYVGRPTFSHSFIPLGIREFVDYTDGLQILFALGALTVCSGLFVIPLYEKLSRSTEVSKGLIVTNNVSNILFIILSAPFIYYLGERKLDIFQTFLILALSNAVVGGYFTLRFKRDVRSSDGQS